MPALTLELTTIPGTIQGKVNYYEAAGGGDYVPQPNPMPGPPFNPNPFQIHDDQTWFVQLEDLKQTGAVFGAFGGNNWEFQVIFELLGPGELAPGKKIFNFPVNTTIPSFTYPTQVINFAAGEIPVGEYKVYATLKMVDANGLTPIAGAGELTGSGKLLQIINA